METQISRGGARLCSAQLNQPQRVENREGVGLSRIAAADSSLLLSSECSTPRKKGPAPHLLFMTSAARALRFLLEFPGRLLNWILIYDEMA